MRDYVAGKFSELKNHPNRWLRITIGILLVMGGLLGALPILGFWMLPLGLILLSADFPWAKRLLVHLRLGWRKFRAWYRGKTQNRVDQDQPPAN